ncbi:MAG TPA: hypothetical protein VGW40_04955 [Allosphingosinicella sp.]|nr:hypothetical protein [Allosphingosinicella sp.]
MTHDAAIEELEAALAAAQRQLEEAGRALIAPHSSRQREAYLAADEALLSAERALAAARGEAHAAPIAFPVRWSTGAPLPHLLQNDHRTLLLFVVEDVDPDWDGSWVRVVGPATEAEIALVEFEGCASAKLGMPNDEAFRGHPLIGRGLHAYGAFKVVHSAWIAELAAINSVHPMDRPETWSRLTHFILGFHDSTFECVARDFRLETRRGSIADALAQACRRMVG